MSAHKETFIDVQAILSAITAAPDPIERINRVGIAITEVENLTAELTRQRREDIDTLIAEGMGQNEIGRRTGLSSARMSQIRRSGPPPERAWFGSKNGMIIVAVAEKREADKAQPGPVVSIDDMQAYDRLRRLAEDLGLKSTYEIVAPPGNVKLNRDGLVLICGPRHSALIEQVLEADDKLGFDRDAHGWHLIDREAGTVYRSPEDSGEPGDIAYLGRLPRPDGKGTFVYIAGIHAAGAAGAVHWLSTELGALYRDVRTRRFSMLVQCRYDPATHEIVASQRITPVYRPEA